MVAVWIMGHVLSGWDGTNPLLNPTNLCMSKPLNASTVMLTPVASLSNVSGFISQSETTDGSLVLSVDRYSPHVIASKQLSDPLST